MKKIFYFIALFIFACTPQEDEKITLPEPPVASFTFKAGKSPNHIVLTNTTSGAFLSQWDLGNGTKSNEASFEAYFPNKGEYEVVLTAFNKGGHGSTKQKITITQDDANACFGNLAILTDCSEKTWKLKPAAGTLAVGSPDFAQTYWANGDADVTARTCAFNDEFKFTSKGVFEYDNKGDFWGEGDTNGNPIPSSVKVGCNTADTWKAPFDTWGSGKHKFSVVGDKLNLVGTGAWMGLYKIGTSAEVTTPQAGVTFKIVKLTKTELVIAAIYPNLEWRFTYIPK